MNFVNIEIILINIKLILLKKYQILLLFNNMLKEYNIMIQILQSKIGILWDQAITKLKTRELRLVVIPEEKVKEDIIYLGYQRLKYYYCRKPGHF